MTLRPEPLPPRVRRGALAFSVLALASGACTEPAPVTPAQPAQTVSAAPTASAGPNWDEEGQPRIVHDAERMQQFVATKAAKLFLARASTLPKVATRKFFHDADRSHYYTEAQAQALPEAARAALKPFEATEEVYYTTHYGSPLSYARPLDILFYKGLALPPGSKLLDFGYGYIGHLRLLATMGVDTTGVDVNPLLPLLYSQPGDQGPISGPNGEKGNIRLIDGYFPSDAKIVSQVGTGYQAVISKNVLKKGYINPDRPIPDPKKQITLGVSDEVALKAFFDTLVPGGYFMIYNICPALTPPDKPFVPYSDGRSPWTRAQFEKAGFEVLVFDEDDTRPTQDMARALGWDQPWHGEPGMDIVNDLYTLFTLVRRPPR